jgi:hypothetical protein
LTASTGGKETEKGAAVEMEGSSVAVKVAAAACGAPDTSHGAPPGGDAGRRATACVEFRAATVVNSAADEPARAPVTLQGVRSSDEKLSAIVLPAGAGAWGGSTEIKSPPITSPPHTPLAVGRRSGETRTLHTAAAPVRHASARAASMERSARAGHAARAAAGTALGQPAAKTPGDVAAHDADGKPRVRAAAADSCGPNESRDAITP